MIVIVCLDETGGMMFGGRRLSRDRAITEKIQEICTGKRLWMNAYSYKLYKDLEHVEVLTDEEFLMKAEDNDICLVESDRLRPAADKIKEIIVFWWNRKYPKDFKLDIDLSEWTSIKKQEFPGNSHEKITVEIYRRNGDQIWK